MPDNKASLFFIKSFYTYLIPQKSLPKYLFMLLVQG
jgi:hypothetical protein